jgi:exoribonuclease R
MAAATRLVGVLELASKYRYGLTSRGAPLYLFRPYDEERPEYVVGCSTRDTQRSQIAVVEAPAASQPLPPPPAKPRANLVRLIGPVGDRTAEEAALLEHWAGTAAATAAAAATEPDTSHDATRTEISAATGWRVFHVDPPGCRDVDDAIAWHPDTDRWAVTIADAAAAVRPGSSTDTAARALGATFYDLAGRAVRPMLPRVISEDSASLLPGQHRRGVSLIFGSDPAALPIWTLSWITVAESFTYDNFAGSAIAAAAGATSTDPHDWIADWMIRYNAAAATLLRTHGAGLLRTQSPADAAAVATWPPALRHLAAEAATYTPATTDAPEHAGLGLPAYTHASSPLRRYADLVNQRAIVAIITGDATASGCLASDPTLADHLNVRTRANRRWTRDLTFLAHVVPGRVQELTVIWLDATRVWVPDWRRILRLRHDPADTPPPGTAGRIEIFCDPTRRNWRQRVLTAPATTATATANTD